MRVIVAEQQAGGPAAEKIQRAEQDRLAELNYPYTLTYAGGTVKICKAATGDAYLIEVIELKAHEQDALTLAGYLFGLHKLIPYIEDELKANIKRYRGLQVSEVLLIADFDNEGNIIATDPECKAAEALQAALNAIKTASKRRRAAEARDKQSADLAQTVNNKFDVIRYNQADDITTTTDYFQREFYSLNPPFKVVENQLSMNLPYIEGKAALLAFFTYDRDYMATWGITDCSFDPGYDYFVAVACDNLFAQGNNIVTLAKILHTMGITYSQKEADKLLQALRKGKAINAIVNNKEILAAWGKNVKTYKDIDGPLIPIRIIGERFIANGNISNLKIEIMAFSPFYQVAEPIKHLTIWDKEIFTLYEGRRVKKYWRVLRFLMDKIAYMRGGNGSNKILLPTLYDYVGDNNSRQADATYELVYKLLDVFKARQYISGYDKAEDKAGTITLHYKKMRNITGQDKKALNG